MEKNKQKIVRWHSSLMLQLLLVGYIKAEAYEFLNVRSKCDYQILFVSHILFKLLVDAESIL